VAEAAADGQRSSHAETNTKKKGNPDLEVGAANAVVC
jgi:hypothetical protein